MNSDIRMIDFQMNLQKGSLAGTLDSRKMPWRGLKSIISPKIECMLLAGRNKVFFWFWTWISRCKIEALQGGDALINVGIIGYLLWRSFYLGGIDWLQFVLWAILPDLASFIPIGASSKRSAWPSWGSNLYNIFHTILVWAVVFFSAFLVTHGRLLAAVWLATSHHSRSSSGVRARFISGTSG